MSGLWRACVLLHKWSSPDSQVPNQSTELKWKTDTECSHWHINILKSRMDPKWKERAAKSLTRDFNLPFSCQEPAPMSCIVVDPHQIDAAKPCCYSAQCSETCSTLRFQINWFCCFKTFGRRIFHIPIRLIRYYTQDPPIFLEIFLLTFWCWMITLNSSNLHGGKKKVTRKGRTRLHVEDVPDYKVQMEHVFPPLVCFRQEIGKTKNF